MISGRVRDKGRDVLVIPHVLSQSQLNKMCFNRLASNPELGEKISDHVIIFIIYSIVMLPN